MERYEHENALPLLEEVLEQLEAGELEYFESGENRDGKKYRMVSLLGPDGPTITGLHRIVAASSLGRWVDRKCDVDHINHDPSDNRAKNLEIVMPSVNRERRRQRLNTSKAVNPDKVRKKVNRQNPQAEKDAAMEAYLAARNQYIDVRPAEISQTMTLKPSTKTVVVAPPAAKKEQRKAADEQSMQKARDEFAAKYAHRRK